MDKSQLHSVRILFWCTSVVAIVRGEKNISVLQLSSDL